MTEDLQEVLRRLTNIELRVTSIDETAAFVARPNKAALLAEVDKLFGNRRRQAQAYLAVNGRRSLSENCEYIGATPNNISPMLTELEIDGLLGSSEQGQTKVYFKKAIDRTVGISRHLQARFSLSKDGRPLQQGSGSD